MIKIAIAEDNSMLAKSIEEKIGCLRKVLCFKSPDELDL
jgi:hypothetical protein